MFFGSRWLDALIERLGLADLVRELRVMLRRDPETGPQDRATAARSESPPSPDTEPVMPKKPEAKSQKPSSSRTAKRQPARTAKAAKPAARKAAAKSSPKAAKGRGGTKAAKPQAPTQAVNQLVDALKSHPQQKDLVSAGQQQKDQLLRSLIPLYLARSLDMEVTSGTTSRFWGEFGVTYAAPNAAKALRMNTGYAQETKKGKAITSKGIKYVEQAMKQARA